MPREPRIKLECDHTKSGKICSCDASFNIHCPSCDYKPMKPSERIEDIYENFMYTSDKDVAPLWGRVHAITRFLDEQYEKETADKNVFEEKGCCDTWCVACEKEGFKRCIHNCSPYSHQEPVSERNALIDELIEAIKNHPFHISSAYTCIEILKSKKK